MQLRDATRLLRASLVRSGFRACMSHVYGVAEEEVLGFPANSSARCSCALLAYALHQHLHHMGNASTATAVHRA
jgi:hypothetical protein